MCNGGGDSDYVCFESMTPSLLEIRDLYKAYVLDGVTIQALRGIDLDVENGEFVAIMGHRARGNPPPCTSSGV